MRFTASRDFSVIEFGREATTLDWYTYDVELRRSADFTGKPMRTITGVRIMSNGDIQTHPYRDVILPVGRVAVSGEESFTMRIIQTSGAGTSYIEAGQVSPDCDAQITGSNQGAALSDAEISLANLSIGTWVCAQTTDGRVASFQVVASSKAALNESGWFDIEYVT